MDSAQYTCSLCLLQLHLISLDGWYWCNLVLGMPGVTQLPLPCCQSIGVMSVAGISSEPLAQGKSHQALSIDSSYRPA